MKWNFGCGYNIICPSKKDLDIPATVKKLEKMGKRTILGIFFRASVPEYGAEDHRGRVSGRSGWPAAGGLQVLLFPWQGLLCNVMRGKRRRMAEVLFLRPGL